MVVVEWVSGLQTGEYKQVFKNCLSSDVFFAKTVEDVSVISRLISLVEHEVTSQVQRGAGNRSRSTTRRTRKRVILSTIAFEVTVCWTNILSEWMA